MNINALPEKLLKNIFTKLKLPDLLRLDLVCTKWAQLQPSLCSEIHDITVLVGDDTSWCLIDERLFRIPHSGDLAAVVETIDGTRKAASISKPVFDMKRNRLEFDWLDPHSVTIIAKHLLNIRHFQISFRAVQPVMYFGEKSRGYSTMAFDSVISLLNQWAPNLVTFKLFVCFTICESNNFNLGHFRSLVAAINSCNSLKHLTLELQNSFDYEKGSKPLLDFTILQSLEEFNCNFADYSQEICDQLVKYGMANDALQAIGLGSVSIGEESLFTKPKYSAEFYRKFHNFPTIQFSEPSEEMQKFCDRFVSLRKLWICVFDLSDIYRMVRLMRPLAELVFLEMNFYLDVVNGVRWSFTGPDAEIPILESVRILNVYAPLHSHTDLYGIKWNRMFPNLEVLHFNGGYLLCEICRQAAELHFVDEILVNGQNINELENGRNVALNNAPGHNNAEAAADPNANHIPGEIAPMANPDQQDDQQHEEDEDQQNIDVPRNGSPPPLPFDEEIDLEEERHRECVRMALQAWVGCAKLRKVFSGFPVDIHEWNITDIVPAFDPEHEMVQVVLPLQ